MLLRMVKRRLVAFQASIAFHCFAAAACVEPERIVTRFEWSVMAMYCSPTARGILHVLDGALTIVALVCICRSPRMSFHFHQVREPISRASADLARASRSLGRDPVEPSFA